MKKLKTFFLASTLALTFSQAQAVQDSVPLSTDSRIRVVPYNQNEVYKFMGHFGYQSAIEFAADEDIKTVSIGDSTSWQIVPNANRLFLKPIESNPQTNMMVVTSKHTYNFELRGKETDNMQDKDMVFVLRFVYPGETDVSFMEKNRVPNPEIDKDPSRYNQSYTISGSEHISPIRIFDDGEFTFFQFKDINGDIPAFFMVDSEGKEAIINYRTVGDYIVVERVTSQFTLRHGKDVACVFNEAKPLKLLPKEEREDKNWFERNLNIF